MKLAAQYFDAYGEFNPIQFLVEQKDATAISAIKIDCDFKLSSLEVLEALKEERFKPIVTTNFVIFKSVKHDYLSSPDGKTVIDLSSLQNYDNEEDSFSEPKIKIFFIGENNQKALKAAEILKMYLKKKSTDHSKRISLLCQDGNNLTLVEKIMKPITIDVDNNYELSFPYEELLEKVENEKPGLILLTGDPGTGKSSLIKHFVQVVNKKFVFVPVDLVPLLAQPSFLKFAMTKFTDAILIIEDAETCLADRKTHHNSAASTLLNVTDGFLADIIGLKIIATVNTQDNIDKALLRKGRLLAKVEFKPLPVEKANNVLTTLKKKSRVLEPVVLADLYSKDEENGMEVSTTQRAIGFQK